MTDLYDYVRALSWFYGKKVDNERGASAVEYALLVAGIAAIIVIAVFALGRLIRTSLENTSSSISVTT